MTAAFSPSGVTVMNFSGIGLEAENRCRREVECGEKSGGEKHPESHFDGSHSQVNFPARR